MYSNTLIYALLLTLFAGLATGIGSLIAFVAKRTNKGLLAFSLGLSGGVMIYVSFVELFSNANVALQGFYGDKLGEIYCIIAFFVGIALIAIIDQLIPSHENPHEIRLVEDIDKGNGAKKLHRMGIFTAFAIAIHNFPEGIATFATTLENPSLGLAIAVAIAIHNIPEGIAVAIPIYYATGSRKRAFWWSLLSGLAEPIGGLLTYFILLPYINEHSLGLILSAVAGIMVYISVDELLPSAREYGKPHISMCGFIAGMAIMAISLVLI